MLSWFSRVIAQFWRSAEAAPKSSERTPVKLFAVLDVESLAAAAPAVPVAFTHEPAPAPAASHAAVAKTRFLFGARIRSVAKLNKKKSRVRAADRRKSKPKSMKRSPALYPVKNKKIVPKRAKTRIVVQKPKRSAVILRFPARPQRSGAIRHQRVA